MPDDDRPPPRAAYLRPVPDHGQVYEPGSAEAQADALIPADVPNREFVVHAVAHDPLLQMVLNEETGSNWPEQRQAMLDAAADRRAALAGFGDGRYVLDAATPGEVEKLVPPGPNHGALVQIVSSDNVLLAIARLHQEWTARCEMMVGWLARKTM